MVRQLGDVETGRVVHGTSDVGHRDHPHAGRCQEEGERPAHLPEPLDHGSGPGHRHVESSEDGPHAPHDS